MLDKLLSSVKQIVSLHSDPLQKCLFYLRFLYYLHSCAYEAVLTLTVSSVQYGLVGM